jgi:hypothetical protein
MRSFRLQAGAQLVSQPPAPGSDPLPVMVPVYAHWNPVASQQFRVVAVIEEAKKAKVKS